MHVALRLSEQLFWAIMLTGVFIHIFFFFLYIYI